MKLELLSVSNHSNHVAQESQIESPRIIMIIPAPWKSALTGNWYGLDAGQGVWVKLNLKEREKLHDTAAS